MKQEKWDSLHLKAFALIRLGELYVEDYILFTSNMALDKPAEALRILERAKATPHL